jgi:hypothetical protein
MVTRPPRAVKAFGDLSSTRRAKQSDGKQSGDALR